MQLTKLRKLRKSYFEGKNFSVADVLTVVSRKRNWNGILEVCFATLTHKIQIKRGHFPVKHDTVLSSEMEYFYRISTDFGDDQILIRINDESGGKKLDLYHWVFFQLILVPL